jgi:hypothetical protein
MSTPETDARQVVINCFTATTRMPVDSPGLGLLISEWLRIRRPTVAVSADGDYKITCATPAAAKRLCDWFGGEVDGSTVQGAIVDLTG